MKKKLDKNGLVGPYRAHPTKAGALLEARRVALDLPGNWKGSADRISYGGEIPEISEWLPCCIHVKSKAKLTRVNREWFCVPEYIFLPTKYSLTPLAAVRKMLSSLPTAYRKKRLEIEKKLIDLKNEEMALAKIKAAMRKK